MNLANDERSQQPRRTFLKRVATALGGAAVLSVGGPLVKAEPPLRQILAVNTGPGYLTPQYLPPGYRFVTQYLGRPDGFRGGDSEIALWYMNPIDPHAFARPISIYQAPHPQQSYLVTTEHRQGAAMPLVMQSGQTVAAQYHDGWWALSTTGHSVSWTTNDVHSLTFTLGNLTVGLRAFREAGIDRTQLLHMAASLV